MTRNHCICIQDACSISITNMKSTRSNLVYIYTVIALFVLTAGRLIMSLTLHMRYRWQESFDDELLMSYSFKEHFLLDWFATIKHRLIRP